MRQDMLEPNMVHDVYVTKLNALLARGRDADAHELASTFADELRERTSTPTPPACSAP
jgi:hypothetical protein